MSLRDKLSDVSTSARIFAGQTLGVRRPEKYLIRDSQRFWTDTSNGWLGQLSHWRGSGIFKDDSRWLAIGRAHLRIYDEWVRMLGRNRSVERIVEWGCGGGTNAIQFAPLAREFYGVDISVDSLRECQDQTVEAGLQNFRPILVDVGRPEEILALLPGPCDFLLSTYVFELIPSAHYGARLLSIFRQLLAKDGIAIVQIKYNDASWRTAARRWNYGKNLAWNATYRIEEFWGLAEHCGLKPRAITLVPREPLVSDGNYAFFLLVKQTV